MPVETRSLSERRANDPEYQDLKRRLIAEWRGESVEGDGPSILEETNAKGRVVHVIVTWDAWAAFDGLVRSEMIVDAFQAVRGEPAVVDLSLAMGLTRAEAARQRVG